MKILSIILLSVIRLFILPLENVILSILLLKNQKLPAPIFVIGPPRSGTTLLYQILINRFYFTYFTNIAAKFVHAPICGLWISKLVENVIPQSNNYVSQYGKTQSLIGPHEAGEFWYRWFPRGLHVYVPAGAVSSQTIQELRKQVVGIHVALNYPVLFKNTYNSMRIASLVEAFPDAIFLVCRRDPLDISQSILEGRLRANGNKDDWWSVPPKEINQIRSHPYWEQVVEQVYYIYKQIESDREKLDSDRFLDISYKELCHKPQDVMEKIQNFFVMRNIKVQVKGDISASFPFSTGKKVCNKDFALLQQKVNELWNN